ncbi:hypothetical protein ASU32_04665 [Tsukamurella tyrosinosolvens]|nr:hypothetical protein ASU32_04665 [Tsukamurella tyrosinosolvens]
MVTVPMPLIRASISEGRPPSRAMSGKGAVTRYQVAKAATAKPTAPATARTSPAIRVAPDADAGGESGIADLLRRDVHNARTSRLAVAEVPLKPRLPTGTLSR